MFEPNESPRLFGLAPGVDFPKALVDGLRARMAGRAPEDMARVRLIVNTRRMQRRVRAIFDQGPPTILPRIQLVTDFGAEVQAAELARPVPPLQRRFELIELISRLLDAEPDLAARASLFDLADSLAGLFSEMAGEGVTPDTIASLDVSDLSGHWQRALRFIDIARTFLDATDTAPDAETRQRKVIEALADQWAQVPPQDPIILAGSTGSRGQTMLLMQAIARLPQGAIVLPGFDFDTPDTVWARMDDALTAEDHPQFRFRKLADMLDTTPASVRPWIEAAPPNSARNKLVSLALRPAPVTDAWLGEGPALPDLVPALAQVTLLKAPSQRDEALAIALRLREAAEQGQTAALITPDRMLTRQVSAALEQWNIRPDDSAGMPLQLSPPGRFLRHVSTLFHRKITAETLLTLLKHPLCHSGTDRADHLLNTRDLELWIRDKGVVYPDGPTLAAWAVGRKRDVSDWVEWIANWLTADTKDVARTLSERLDTHIAVAERIAQGPGDGAGRLWDENAGREAARLVQDIAESAPHAGEISAPDYSDLFGAVMAGREVRDRDAGHPHILIWGTLEARVQGADLVILGGLNEGSWPETPPPDPWLNRQMRHDAGLLLPERRIGLSAHDFQQAIAAPEVWLTRSLRSDEAETVPSRWLNRIENLMSGLPGQGGQQALSDMAARGNHWLSLARALEAPTHVAPAHRPSPCPPIDARPRQLSVTRIKTLIRDPYAIYARDVLRLKPLNSLMKTPDALLRGIVVHDILEGFIRQTLDSADALTVSRFLAITDSVLAENVPWPSARALWKARLIRLSDYFVTSEQRRRQTAVPIALERSATSVITALGFTLTGKADRIDQREDGRLILYDYKTGNPPTPKQQKDFDKQLLLEAAMAERGDFDRIDPSDVSDAVFIGLGNPPKDVAAPLDEIPATQVWEQFEALIGAYLSENRGFSARIAMFKDTDTSDYDQLARFGEWDLTQLPVKEVLS
ncbi:double-strand break repair protein AddB [Shimia biformata]|uniref:double-strand break repair protein AddB n=1 Tax=Shimia biformata TaxID=1294299 RepID=UPI001950D722|nr:double-strand break repair protein AddB [Shimia biformata]